MKSPSTLTRQNILSVEVRSKPGSGCTVQIVGDLVNHAPVAHAGPDQTARVGQTVHLDGSSSSDVDGDALTFQWQVVTRPPGSHMTLADPRAVTPTFLVDTRGTYEIQLIVQDGIVASAPDRVLITTENVPPVAHAGSDQRVGVGTTITLDGSQSSDVDGDLLTFFWAIVTQPSGSQAALSDPVAVKPTFVVDIPGIYEAQLLVHDGQAASMPAMVQVSTVNAAPVAEAGPDQTVFVGQAVHLDGSQSSDVDGDALTYHWIVTVMPPGSQAALGDPMTVRPMLTVDVRGTYVVQLTVHDGQVASAPDTVTILMANSPPVAHAGLDQSVVLGQTVQLDGSHSTDADRDPLSWRWSFTALPPASTAVLSDDLTSHPTFQVDRHGLYAAQLIVRDGQADSAPDTVVISTVNSKPVANAGVDQQVTVGDSVTLDGRGSADADGDPLLYTWALLAQPTDSTAVLSDLAALQPVFVADRAGLYVIQLLVDDGQEVSVPDTVTVTAVQPNRPPVITSTPVLLATVGQPYTYDVDATDPDTEDTLTFALSTAPTGMTIHATTGVIQWTPTAAQVGSHPVTVRVQDQGGLAATQSFTITVPQPNRPPQITSSPGTTATAGQPYSYAVTATDPDAGDVLTFALPTAPAGMSMHPSTGLLQWTPDVTQAGSHPVTVRVQDQGGLFAQQSFMLTVGLAPVNHPPQITSTPLTTASVAQAYSYDVEATDPDAGDELAFTLLTAPSGMTIDAVTGLLQWTPTAAQSGTHEVTVRVHDPGGLATTQTFLALVTVSPPGCLPPPPGIVSWWPGDGNANDIVDSNAGTLEAGATFATGHVGPAFRFDKLDDFVFVSHNANLAFGERQDFTIEAWINLQHPVQNTDDWIFHKGDTRKTAQCLSPHAYSLSVRRMGPTDTRFPGEDGRLRFALSTDCVDHDLFSSMPVPVGQWTHVVAARQGNVGLLYINGVLSVGHHYIQDVLSPSPTMTDGTLANTDPLAIGHIYDTRANPPVNPNLGFGGSLDEVTLYNRALTAQEIQAIVAAGSAGKCKGPPGNHPPTITSTPHVSRWMPLTPTGTPPAVRWLPGASYDPVHDRLIVFGGDGLPVPHFNDVWVLENAAGYQGPPAWVKLTPTGGPPPGRVYVSAVYDMTANRLIIHGGCDAHCGTILGDTWVLTHANGLGGTPEWIRLPLHAPLAGYAAVYDPISNRMIVFGGLIPPATDTNTVRILQDANGIGTPAWSTLTPLGEAPPPRGELASTAYDAVSNRLLVFGGAQHSFTFLNDAWVLTNANGLGGPSEWIRLEPTGGPPAPRSGHATIYDANSGRLIVTEGVSAVSRGGVITFYPDVWVLDHANGRGGPPAWTLLPTSNHPSIGREFFAYGYHPASNRLVVGLGLSDTQPELQQDAWVLTNASGQCTAHQPCTYDVEATDPDGDPLTFSLDAAPAGMTIDAATGLLTWTPTPAQIGNHTVTVRVHDNGGGAAIQTFTLTVAPVAVPNVVGLDPVSAEALIGAADLSVGAITQAGGAITLRFDTLPSAQGWSYVSDGAAEASIFSVSGSALTQDTDDFAGAATIQHYQRSAVSPSLPFSISVRARVLADSTTGFGQPNAFGFCFSGCTGAECFAIGLDTGRIQAVTGAVLSTTIDNTQFHDYRLVATPGVGFELYVDHVLLATGPPRVEASNASLLLWGDCTRGQGAHAEVTAFSFMQQPRVISQHPSAGTLVVNQSAVDLTVVDGPATAIVPDVVGQTQAAAHAAIGAATLTVGALTNTPSQTVPTGSVVSHKPVAGTAVPPGSAVDLVISTGPVGNVAPSITSTAPTTAAVEQLYTYDVDTTDPNVGDILTYALPTFPTGMTIHTTTGLIQWTPTAGQAGDHPVTVRVQDSGGLFATQSFTLTVTQPNRPPQITSTPLLVATAGQPYSYDVDATDPDPGATLTFSLLTAPTGMTIHATTGLIQWTPTAAQVGAQAVTVQVQDAGTLAATQPFTVTVAAGAPVTVPDVLGTIPTAAATVLTAAPLTVGPITTVDTTLPLSVTTLPSAQGWVYGAFDNTAPESRAFAISNGMLQQNTLGLGTSTDPDVLGGNLYQLPATVDPHLSFTLSLTTRVLQDEGDPFDPFSFSVGVVTATEQFAIGINTRRVRDTFGEEFPLSIDLTQFHEYRLEGTPGVGFRLFIDHILVGTGQPFPRSAPGQSFLSLGDASALSNARADVQAFAFQQGAGLVIAQAPLGGTLAAAGTAVHLTVAQAPASVLVPSVVGVPQASAMTTLVAAQLSVGVIQQAFSPTVPTGSVLSQTPAAGATVPARTAVELVISRGPPQVTVPNVVGATQASATATLLAAQLTVGSVTTQYSATVPAGQVVSQAPAAGTTVNAGTAVSLVVSLGPPAQVAIPDVVAQLQATAEITLAAAGLLVGAVGTAKHPTVPAGQVISQQPAAGTLVLQGSAVTLLVSLGPSGPQDLASVLVQPVTPLLLATHTQTVAVMGVLGNGSSLNLAGQVIWASSNPAIATVNSNGVVTGVGAGTVTISATKDGITGTILLTIGQLAPGDTTVPTAALTAPAHHAVVTSPTAIVGTATDANFFKYVLEYAPAGTTTFTVLTTGTAPVTNGVLGTLDPTLLLNDLYTLRLTVVDRANNTAEASIQVQVAREQKVGIFTVAFQDVSLPVACLPLTVTRVYDSRDKTPGDFGVGWRLDVQTMRLRESREQGSAWHVDLLDVPGPFGVPIPTFFLLEDDVHKISLTLPDGHVEEFDLTPTPNQSQFAPIQQVTASYTPRPGTLGTLTSVPAAERTLLLTNTTGTVELLTAETSVFNPRTFEYTTPDGTVFTIDKVTGVQQVQCTNGPTLTIGPNGITHSLGTGVTFIRDAQGRITTITDPNGHVRQYAYDANGDLVSYTDPEGQITRFLYNVRHGLLEINDPRGVRAIRNEYDANGRLLSHTDAAGQAITYTRDLVARTETVTNRLGQATTYEYDDKGNVLRQVDAAGGSTTFTYDAFGNELTRTDPLGRTTERTYDSRRNVLREVDPLGHATSYTYTARNAVRTITDALGRVTTNTYDAQGNLTETIDPLGHRTTHTYDTGGVITQGTGNLLSTTNALGQTTSYAYNSLGRLTQETNPLGHVTTYTYDANGNRTTQTTTLTTASGPETLVTTYAYDGLNRLVQTTAPDGSTTQTLYNAIGKQSVTIDQLGRLTSYAYDDQGRLTGTTSPDGTSESSTYDAEGRRLTSTDRAGRVTTSHYDVLGRLVRTTYPDGATQTTTYDAAGQVLATTDARGNTTTYAYDAAGRRTTVTDALGHATTFTYDQVGNQQTMTDANTHATTFVYDNANRRTRVIHPDTTVDQTAYDALGRTASKTDQAGKTTQFTYDALSRLIKVTDALGQETTYTYDEAGKQLTQTDTNGHTTQFAYDMLGRRAKRTLPLGQTETYAYDAAGRLTKKTDFNGKMTTYTYDAVNRLVKKTPDPSLSEPAIQFTYTTTGQRASMIDASGVTTYTYDNRDRLIAKATPQGTLSYIYDTVGNLLSMRSSNANGVSVDYTYDQLNRLKMVKDNRLTNGTTTYSYDNVGNLQSYVYPNGVKTEHSYNTLNRLTNLTIINVSTLASYTYTLGLAGNRTSVTEHSGRKASYTYDDLYRLTAEKIENDPAGVNGTISYEYDPVGNRKTRTSTVPGIPSTMHTYDADDRLTTDIYDNNGNTTGSDGKTYAYDFENHLTNQNSGDVSIVYDGDGNRVVKTVGGVITRFLVDDRNLTGYAQVVEEIVNGAAQRVYTYGLNRVSQSQASETSFYGYDGQGSVRLLVDAAGVVTDRYDYEAFGVEIATLGSIPNDYRYAGEQRDPALALLYLRSRYLDVGRGRFLSRDNFEGQTADPRSLHKYVYVANNPITLIDPSGHSYTLANVAASVSIIGTLVGMAATTYFSVFNRFSDDSGNNAIDGWLISLRGNVNAIGGSLGGGIDAVLDQSSNTWYVAPVFEFGTAPLSIFQNFRLGTPSITAGPVFHMTAVSDLEGTGFSAAYPLSIIHLLPRSLISVNRAWGALSQLAKNDINGRGNILIVGLSTTGPSYFTVGLKSNTFSFTWSETNPFTPVSQIHPTAAAVINPVLNTIGSVLISLGNSVNSLVTNADKFFASLR